MTVVLKDTLLMTSFACLADLTRSCQHHKVIIAIKEISLFILFLLELKQKLQKKGK